MPFFYLGTAVVLNGIANILLKVSATKGVQLHGFRLATIVDNVWLVVGLVLFASNVIFYYMALQQIHLSVAYPVMVGATFLIVNLTAFFFLREEVTTLQLAGYLLIVTGIMLVLGVTKLFR